MLFASGAEFRKQRIAFVRIQVKIQQKQNVNTENKPNISNCFCAYSTKSFLKFSEYLIKHNIYKLIAKIYTETRKIIRYNGR